jgi:spore germination protein YaaH
VIERNRITGLVALLVAALIVGACGGVTPSTSTNPAEPAESPANAGSTPEIPETPVPIPKHEVYGYVPYWEMDEGIADHLAKTELTTLALFSVTHRRNGALAKTGNGYKRIIGGVGKRLIREARERGVRVELVYSSFGEQKNSRFYTEPEAQERWIDELVEFAVDLGVDGVNVDVELLPAEHVAAYGAFVGRLRTALRARLPDAQISVATQANDRGASMASVAAAAGADRIFLMGYDYHWAGSDPGASAPIEQLDGEPRDLVWSLDRYASLGVPVDRTILGLPLYGMTWPVIGPGVGSPASGRGDTWVPRLNLRVFEDSSFTPTFEPVESVEFYAVPSDPDAAEPTSDEPGSASASAPPEPGWNAVYYDSPRSLTPKLALADARGLAGAGFWAIGYERGLPGYTDLIATFRAGELAAP